MEHTCEQNLNPLSMHFLTLAMLQKPNSLQNCQEPSNPENIEIFLKKSMVKDIEYKVWEW